MKTLPTTLAVLGVCCLLGQSPVGGPAQGKPGGAKREGGQGAGVTIWILAYERQDAAPAADHIVLPAKVKPALEQLKAKGARRMQFNFQRRQLYVWLEGSRVATVEDIRKAFPGLTLNPIASAQFTGDAVGTPK